jgi:capsular polysaccharide transport system permease protein
LHRDISIIGALIIRDMMGRFGRRHLGFVWTVLEPMILTTGVMLIWSTIHDPFIHGIPVVAFVLTGYLPLTLWRHLTGAMVRIVRRHSSLLYHRPVLIGHIVVARVLLEVLSLSIALAVSYFAVITFGIIPPVYDWGLALLGWLMSGWYYGALGLVIAALTEIWEPAEKFVQPMNYLALPLSGVFFMADWLPGWAQNLLLVNPSVHCFEMFRAGFLGPEFTTHFSVPYLATSSLVVTLLGIVVLRGARERLDLA